MNKKYTKIQIKQIEKLIKYLNTITIMQTKITFSMILKTFY